MYTLAQAAKVTRLTKTAIQKSIKKGRLSASKNDFGHYRIDPAELHRVYEVVVNPSVESEREETEGNRQVVTNEHVRMKELETQLAMKDQLLEMKDHALNDLRQRVEDTKKDRDHWRQQATYLLEGKQGNRKGSWFMKLFKRPA